MLYLLRDNSLINCNFLRQAAKLTICVGILLFVGACQPPATATKSQLSAELLSDILVSTIAAQREEFKLALKFLSKAAYRSGDDRLIIESIRVALAIEEYQHASELAQFFNRLEPDNPTVILFLAKTQFRLGDSHSALLVLIDLVRNKTDDDVSLLQDIAILLAQQNQKTILTEFTKHLEKTPANANFSAQLTLTAALLASKLQNSDEYIRLLDKTLRLKPDWEVPGILKLIALYDYDIGRVNRFVTTYLNRYPQHNLFRLEYAYLLIRQNEMDNALTQIEGILQGKPTEIQHNADALYAAGILYRDKNLLEESRKMLVRYLELSTDNQNQTAKDQDRLRDDQSRIYLSDIELKLKNHTVAISYLHDVSSAKHYLNAQIKMAWVIAEREGVDSALAHLQQIYTAKDNQESQILLAQGRLLSAHHQLDQAKLVLDEGLRQYPEHPDILYTRGLLARQMKLLELHEHDIRKVIALQPENAYAYNALGYTLSNQTDRLDEALTLISKAQKLLPDDPSILDSMGWVHFKLGNNAQSLQLLQRAFSLNHNAEIAAHLGEVLWVSDNQDEAMKIWAQGIKRAPENLVLKDTIERFSQLQSGNQSLVDLLPISRI